MGVDGQIEMEGEEGEEGEARKEGPKGQTQGRKEGDRSGVNGAWSLRRSADQ